MKVREYLKICDINHHGMPPVSAGMLRLSKLDIVELSISTLRYFLLVTQKSYDPQTGEFIWICEHESFKILRDLDLELPIYRLKEGALVESTS